MMCKSKMANTGTPQKRVTKVPLKCDCLIYMVQQTHSKPMQFVIKTKYKLCWVYTHLPQN